MADSFADAEQSWQADMDQAERRLKQGNTAAHSEAIGRALVAFPLMSFADITLDRTKRNYLIKNILPRRGLAVIWGAPKCYKSFSPLTWRCTSRSIGTIAAIACNRRPSSTSP
jgi:hypothetical protein